MEETITQLKIRKSRYRSSLPQELSPRQVLREQMNMLRLREEIDFQLRTSMGHDFPTPGSPLTPSPRTPEREESPATPRRCISSPNLDRR